MLLIRIGFEKFARNGFLYKSKILRRFLSKAGFLFYDPESRILKNKNQKLSKFRHNKANSIDEFILIFKRK